MALPQLSSLLGWATSLNFSYVGLVAIGIIVLFLVIWAMRSFSARRNMYGTDLAREVDYEAGLFSVRSAFRGATKLSLFAAAGTISLLKAVWTKAKSLKGQGAEASAEEGAAKGVEAAEEAEKATAALEAIKGRALDLIAGLKLVEGSLEKYVKRRESEDKSEEKEAEFIENIGTELAKLSNYDKIDSSVLGYLRKLMSELKSGLDGEIEIKKAKKSEVKELILALRMAINEMKSVLKEAKAEEGVFKKFEKKVKKDYSAEVKKLKEALKKRKKELKQAKSKGKNADPNLIATLEKEIALMERQYNAANNLNKQLKITFGMVKDEVKKSRRVIKKLQKYGKQMKNIDKKVEKIESHMEKNMDHAIESAKKLQGALKAFEQNSDVYAVALSVSGSLNEFLKENEKEAELNVEFDGTLRNIVAVGYGMARLTVAYEQLIDGLTKADETIDQGLEVLIKIMQSVVTDSEVQVSEQQAAENMDRLNKMLDNQKGIDSYLKNLIASIKYKLNVLYVLIERLTNEELQLAASLQRYSGYLGRMIAVAFNRKVEIDKTYMNQAETFERILQQRNETAYTAYQEAKAA